MLPSPVNHRPAVYATPPLSTVLKQRPNHQHIHEKNKKIFFVCLCFVDKITEQRSHVDVFSCHADKYTCAGGSNVPFRCRNPPRCIQAWLALSPWRPSYSAAAVSWLHGRLTFSLLKDEKKKVLNAGEHNEECNRSFGHPDKFIITVWHYNLSGSNQSDWKKKNMIFKAQT